MKDPSNQEGAKWPESWMKDVWIGNSADFTYQAHKARHVSLDKDGSIKTAGYAARNVKEAEFPIQPSFIHGQDDAV